MALTSRLAAAGALQAAIEGIYAYDSNGNVVGLNNTNGTILYISSDLFVQTTMPIIIPPSGNIASNGTLTLGALPAGSITFGATTAGAQTVTGVGTSFASTDVGRTIVVDSGKLCVITAFASTTSVTATVPVGGLTTAAFANTAWRLVSALNETYTKCYMYFPANAVATVSSAGFYYTVMDSTWSGTVYLTPVYSSGIPTAPTSTTSVTDGRGAYTSTNTQIDLLTIPIIASTMGKNGSIECETVVESFSSAASKFLWIYFGSKVLINPTITTNRTGRFSTLVWNQESSAYQKSTYFTDADSSSPTVTQGANAPLITTQDTSANIDFKIQGRSPAVDWFMLSYAQIKVNFASN